MLYTASHPATVFFHLDKYPCQQIPSRKKQCTLGNFGNKNPISRLEIKLTKVASIQVRDLLFGYLKNQRDVILLACHKETLLHLTALIFLIVLHAFNTVLLNYDTLWEQ